MAAIELDVTSRTQGTWAVAEVSGEVDMFTAPKLREHLARLIDEDEGRLVVDLRSVTFIDSTGLGVLIGALRRVREREGDLRLACEEGPVRRVLEITGLDGLFSISSSPEQATEA